MVVVLVQIQMEGRIYTLKEHALIVLVILSLTPVSMAGFENTIVVEDIVIIHTYNVPMVNAVLEENVME